MPASPEDGGSGVGHEYDATALGIQASPRQAAEHLGRWLEARRFAGPDPYSGLAAPRARILGASAVTAQGAIQVTKRFPRVASAVFGHSHVAMAKTMALALSAYAILDEHPSARVRRLRTDLLARRTPSGGFGYEFPVVTRWGSYGQNKPNLVATTFALQGLADAAEVARDGDAPAAGLEIARFALEYFGATTTFLAYHANSSILVHNANVLACGQIARSFRAAGSEPPDQVFTAARLSLAAQRPDGAWPYADHPRCGWVDTFHTLYILDGLHELAHADPDGPWKQSFDRGLAYVYGHCLSDHGPLELPDRDDRPLEGHTVGTALSFFARRTTDHSVLRTLLAAADVLALPDGSFAAHATDGNSHGPAYPRWVGAHMLVGLATSAAELEEQSSS